MRSISRRLFFFSFSVLVCLSAHGQKIQHSISVKPEWMPLVKTMLKSGEASSLQCNSCGVDAGNNSIPIWSEFVPGIQASSAEIKNGIWEEIPFWELVALDTSYIKSNPEGIRIIPSEQKKKSGSRIEARLIRLQGKVWQKLTGGTILIQGEKLIQSKPSVPAEITANENSVFQTGTWIKIGIVKTGVYQIRNSDLQSFGLDLEGKSSARIRMFGSGGKQLSEANRDFRFEDIREIPIQVEDGGDGVFQGGDRILFYGEDPNQWSLNKNAKAYEFKNNIYSDSSYYFLTFSTEDGLRVTSENSVSDPEFTISSYPERWIYAPETVNALSLGRVWYADVLDFSTSKDIVFQTDALCTDSVFRFRFGLMARSGIKYPFKLKVNGTALNDTSPEQVNLNSTFGYYGRDVNALRYFKPGSESGNLVVNVQYQKSGNPESIGYINFVEATGWRKLVWRPQGFGFRSFEYTGKKVSYNFNGLPNDARIWDVSNRHSIRQINLVQNSIAVFQDTIKEFHAFSPSDALVPAVFKRISNQNLRGLQTPDLLIVSHPTFLDQAYRLADFRRNHDGMDVEVVSTDKVYNEFSSGAQDISAIRNLAMHLYYKNSDTISKLKYLLLFGDGSYDYKNRVDNNFNMMPTYESPSSLYILSSYASDDYFGILAKNKGGWEANDFMDIGVGRLPSKNPEESKALVDKLIHYASSKKCLGNWRNRYTFVADNGDYCEHSRQSNELSESLLANNSSANVKKLFIGAYERIAGAGGYTSPAATNDLLSSIEKGNLLVNYTGHGGETVWADEFLFTSEMIDKLRNYDRLSFFVTATCDFGRHDHPAQLSGAESLLLNDKGGAIGIMTTGRPVGSANNFAINQSFYKNFFKPINGKMGRMGDAIREAKNNNADKISNRGFTLLGDPSASFAFPEEEISITKLNDTIRGLDMVELEGEILESSEVRDSIFQGRVYSTLYDRPGLLSIIDGEPCNPSSYGYQRSILYNGSAPVKDGRFSLKFFVSGDISYLTGNGRISLYAQDTTRILDAAGSRKNLKVGGLNPNPIEDQNGPVIRLFMNDTTFFDRGLTGENADLLVFLRDFESGINVTGLGLGHDLVAVLDEGQSFVLNEFFENDEGSFQNGRLRFPLRGLSAGDHFIRVRAWDNFNNSSEAVIHFTVGISEINNLIAKELSIFPNPFSDKVYFRLESAFAGENAQVNIEIIDLAGQKIAEKSWNFAESAARPGASGELFWDGTKPDGSKLPAGMYFCRIVLKSDTADGEFKITRKLVLIR